VIGILVLGYTAVTDHQNCGSADTTQTAIGAVIGTSIGDGVDFTIELSNNEV
jgi:hypothetical protein